MEERFQRAKQYQEKLEAEENVRKEAARKELATSRSQSLERAKGIMEGLKVREALEDVKGEWKCGEIVDLGFQFCQPSTFQCTGLELVHHFPMVKVEDMLSQMQIELSSQKTSLQIFVCQDIEKPDEKPPVLSVTNTGIFRRYLNPYSRISVIRDILNYGLIGGLKLLQDKLLSEDQGLGSFILQELDETDVEERFNQALVISVNFRADTFSSPLQIAKRSDQLTDQFPDALREKNVLDFKDLKKWEHELVWGRGLLPGLGIWKDRIVTLGNSRI